MTSTNAQAGLKGLCVAALTLTPALFAWIGAYPRYREYTAGTFSMGAARAQDIPSAKPSGALLDGLKGTVALPSTICSASLVTLKGRNKTEKALLLTSGHCIGRGSVLGRYPGPGEILERVKESRAFLLETGNPRAPRAPVRTEELVYATMTVVDIAIYRLAESYDEIDRRTGVTPFLVSAETRMPPGIGVRIPSAFHGTNQTCATDTTVLRLKEGVWNWGPVLRIAGACRFPPGSSGSPVIRVDTNEVIGVLGTVYEGSRSPCDLHNPCEIDEEGTVSVAEKGQPYAHFVHQLYACLDDRGRFDAKAAGCRLPGS